MKLCVTYTTLGKGIKSLHKSKGHCRRMYFEIKSFCEEARKEWNTGTEDSYLAVDFEDDEVALNADEFNYNKETDTTRSIREQEHLIIDKSQKITKPDKFAEKEECRSWRLVEALLCKHESEATVQTIRHCSNCKSNLKKRQNNTTSYFNVLHDTKNTSQLMPTENVKTKTLAQRERKKRKKQRRKLKVKMEMSQVTSQPQAVIPQSYKENHNVRGITIKVKPFSVKTNYLQEKFGTAYEEALVYPRLFAINLIEKLKNDNLSLKQASLLVVVLGTDVSKSVDSSLILKKTALPVIVRLVLQHLIKITLFKALYLIALISELFIALINDFYL